jgi:hypothetical protein
MRDVEYLAVKGHYNFKALTERAKEKMGAEIGGPWRLAAEVFFMHVPADKFESTVTRLNGMGLQTEPDQIGVVDIRCFTDF